MDIVGSIPHYKLYPHPMFHGEITISAGSVTMSPFDGQMPQITLW